MPTKKIIDQKTGRVRIITVQDEPNKTEQHHKDAHDINNIMKKYQKVGINYNALPPTSRGAYGDFTGAKNFYESTLAVMQAQESFNSLPSTVRKRFNNNPQELFDFLNDKKNRDEAISLGLIDAPPPSTEPKTPTESPTTTTTNK